MKRLFSTLIFSLLLFFGQPISAQVYNPWVLAKGQPDTRDLRKVTEALYAQAGARTDREKAEILWRFLLTDGRFVEPGMFYHIAGWAYEEPCGEVLDPLKLLNSYGFGLCYQDGPLLESLFEAGGFKDSRVWFVTGHTVAEVFFDGKYNMFDSDMLGYTTLGQGDPRKSPVASVHELELDSTIILGKMLAPNKADSTKVVYPWYPADVHARAMSGYAELFTSREDNWLYPYPRSPQGHSMDFTLRPGERLVRYFAPERDSLYYLPYKNKGGVWSEFPQEREEYKIRTGDGPKSQKDWRRWATGRIEYQPQLWNKDSYYPLSGAGFNENLKLPVSSMDSLTRLDSTSPATAVFEMPSPYVLIDAEFSLAANLATPEHRVTFETSTDGGRTWQYAGNISGPFHGPWQTRAGVLTVSDHGTRTAVSGLYCYLVRVRMSGPDPAQGVMIWDLRLTSLIQVNPRTLPALNPGVNELVYSPGPRLKKWTVPLALDRLAEFALKVDNLECVIENDNLIILPGAWKEGQAVFALAAPDSGELTEFQAGGRFLVLEHLAPEKTTAETRKTSYSSPSPSQAKASIAWSLSPDGPYTTIWEYNPAISWLDNKPEKRTLRWPEVDRRISGLPSGVKVVYLKYTLDGMALDDLRIALFTSPPARQSRLVITHVWAAGNSQSSQTMEITKPEKETSYKVDAGTGSKIENKAVIFYCP